MRVSRLLLAVLFCISFASFVWAKETEHLVRLSDVDPAIVVDLQYATSNNFTHKKIYPIAIGIARKETAEKLARANAEFQKSGYRIKVWDAYRPPYVQKIFWNLVPDDRYVANPYKGGSRHNRGGAVDVTLVDKDGKELDMPSAFDDFSSKAWPNNFALSTKVRTNLKLLRQVMMAQGFVPLEHEWWHFDDANWKNFPLVDVLLEKFLLPPEILNSLNDVTEAVVVDSLEGSVSQATLVAWEKQGEQWNALMAADAVVGRNGVAAPGEKREGDGKTPSGIFHLGLVFGYDPSIETKMTYRQVTDEDIWVDDVHSKDYNHWINIKDAGDAKSFEKMKRADDLYRVGAVIEYNTNPVVVGLGSAIFLHIWRNFDKPTAGCVALSYENVSKLAKWLDASQKPVIIINPQ